MNKSYRQGQIVNLIAGRAIHTQDELARALKDVGPGETPSASAGVLVALADGSLEILRATELSSIAPHVDFAELPLIVDEGALVEGAIRSGLLVREVFIDYPAMYLYRYSSADSVQKDTARSVEAPVPEPDLPSVTWL